MRIQHLTTPFNHTLIYDMYSPQEYSLILTELKSLKPYMADKTQTGDPRSNGMTGLSLDWHYKENRSQSDILNKSSRFDYY